MMQIGDMQVGGVNNNIYGWHAWTHCAWPRHPACVQLLTHHSCHSVYCQSSFHSRLVTMGISNKAITKLSNCKNYVTILFEIMIFKTISRMVYDGRIKNLHEHILLNIKLAITRNILKTSFSVQFVQRHLLFCRRTWPLDYLVIIHWSDPAYFPAPPRTHPCKKIQLIWFSYQQCGSGFCQ